jgi:Leucine rich repeat
LKSVKIVSTLIEGFQCCVVSITFVISIVTMWWQFVVHALISTIGVIAIKLDCVNDNTDCRLYDVRTNTDNEIYFPRKFNRNLAQKSTKIEIKRSKFRKFPINFFDGMPNVIFLIARDCGLETLNSSLFGLNSSYSLIGIETLDLAYNLVETLEAYTFRQTKNLIHLDMSHNLLFHIDAHAFHGLSRLDYLNLSHNQLTNLDQLVFTPIQSLTQLDLGTNHLQTLNLDILHDNVELKDLILAKNKLSMLKITLINNVIRHIDLSGNQLVDISALGKIKAMHTLELADNKNVNLISKDFSAMAGLNRLDLDGVDLQRRINNNYQFLKPLRQLLLLQIGRNNLTSLSQLSHSIISRLDVDGNEISELDIYALKLRLPELAEININNNPWNCQALTKVLEQLERLKIVLSFRGDVNPVPPAGRTNVKGIVCDKKVPSPTSKVGDKYDLR